MKIQEYGKVPSRRMDYLPLVGAVLASKENWASL